MEEIQEEILIPTFEVVSHVSIDIAEMQENRRNGESGKTKIIDKMTGKTLTFGELNNNLNRVLLKDILSHDYLEKGFLWKII